MNTPDQTPTPPPQWDKQKCGYLCGKCQQFFEGTTIHGHTCEPPQTPEPRPDPQNEPHTCPYCDQPREDTFAYQFRFACGTSLRRDDHKTVKQGSECKLRVAYSKLLVEHCKLKESPTEQAGACGWWRIEGGLPEYMTAVLVWCPETENTYCAYYYFYEGAKSKQRMPLWAYFDNNSKIDHLTEVVTHWQPLPPPPDGRRVEVREREEGE
jgi:hypothetical protein